MPVSAGTEKWGQVIAQVNETLKGVESLADKQGQAFALLALILIAGGVFMFWLVKFLLAANQSARTEFLAALDNRDKLVHERNEKIVTALEKLSDAVKGNRR